MSSIRFTSAKPRELMSKWCWCVGDGDNRAEEVDDEHAPSTVAKGCVWPQLIGTKVDDWDRPVRCRTFRCSTWICVRCSIISVVLLISLDDLAAIASLRFRRDWAAVTGSGWGNPADWVSSLRRIERLDGKWKLVGKSQTWERASSASRTTPSLGIFPRK